VEIGLWWDGSVCRGVGVLGFYFLIVVHRCLSVDEKK
jgi:hypothetical protein